MQNIPEETLQPKSVPFSLHSHQIYSRNNLQGRRERLDLEIIITVFFSSFWQFLTFSPSGKKKAYFACKGMKAFMTESWRERKSYASDIFLFPLKEV